MDFTGLKSKDVRKNRSLYGENKLPDIPLKKWYHLLWNVFQDKLNCILFIMMLIFLILAIMGEGSITEALGIAFVLFIVIFLNIKMGLNSQKSIKELKDKTAQHYVNVIRDNKTKRIHISEIVVGDLIIIQQGESIYADGYLINGSISVDNSVLNGETAECKKNALNNYKYIKSQFGLKKQITMDDIINNHSLYSGTTILDGEGIMVVTNVGINTLSGSMACTLNDIKQEKTSLQIQLDSLANQIAKFGYISAIIITIILFGNIIYGNNGFSEYFNLGTAKILSDILSILILSFTIIVAAVPEGLPLIISIITSQNIKQMIKENVLAKNVNKIPEAGNIQLLCTDKTGTLTYGILKAEYNFLGNGKEVGFNNLPNKYNSFFLANAALNNTSVFVNNKIQGNNTTSNALLELIGYENYKKTEISCKVFDKLPFNSIHKFSCARIKNSYGEYTYFLGAPEILLDKAKYYMDTDGKIKKINKKLILQVLEDNMKNSVRFIAMGYSKKYMDKEKKTVPNDIIITSFIGLKDNVRKEVPNAVLKMHNAGVMVMMITGDILTTAIAIAKDSKIINSDDDIAITAFELDKMSDTELSKKLHKIKVIARATPTTKLRIINISQKMHICCGMCGDGTNDSLALKKADVGFSMGNGTDVCKEAGDIIITDSNFVSITNAVMLGRTFIHNIAKFLKFQLPINITLVLMSILYPIIWRVEAFTAVQILIINIVMDSLNSLSFGGEPSKIEYMLEKPIPKGSNLISKTILSQVVISILAFTGIFYITTLQQFQNIFSSEQEYLSARFALIIFVSMINGFNIRTDSLNIFKGILNNTLFIKIFSLVILGTILMITFGGNFINTTDLSMYQWIILFLLALTIIPIDMIRKIIIKLL